METFLNSDMAKLLAVLLSIIAIIYLFLRHKKDEASSNIHLYYISGIATLIILELVTYICVNNDNTTNIISYISFASTLSSLILSLVAIIYSIVSNKQGESQYKKIDNASDKISLSVDRFQSMTEELTMEMKNIITRVDELKEISKETQKCVQGINQGSNSSYIKGKNIDTNVFVENYIKAGSFLGNLSILACIYSQKKNKPFKLSDITDVMPDYFYGYIISSSAMGIIITAVVDDSFKCNFIYQGVEKQVLHNIENFINNSGEMKEKNQQALDKIKAFFNIQ